MPFTKLSSKGQLVIPKEIREAMDLHPGTTLRVVAKEGRIILEPLKERILDRLDGKFAGEKLLEALEAEHRAEVEGEARP
jgi:AbrB family looped-hinge helix DNA binding protein